MSFALPGVVKIPEANSFEEAVFIEPVNTVLKAVHRLSLLPRDAVCIIGQGPIGLIFTRILTIQGRRVFCTDLFNRKLAKARNWGAKAVFSAESADVAGAIVLANKDRGMDAAIVTVPSDAAVQLGRQVTRAAGQVLLFAHTIRGIPSNLDLAEICMDEKDLIGSYSSDFTLQAASGRLVFSRQIDVRGLISHRFPIWRISDALSLASKPQSTSGKILISF
jgi:L-iditol 2-dehydrogenase